MEYQVIESANRIDLVRRVNAKLVEGWEPQGGIMFSKESLNSFHFWQAIVKK